MARNDFFLDSGIIYGQFDPRDDYFNGCKKHLVDYPYEEHNYYAPKQTALREVESIGWSKRKRPVSRGVKKSNKLFFAGIKIQVEKLFDSSRVIDIDYASTHTSFNELYSAFLKFLGHSRNNPKDRDAKILTNAFIWDKEWHELHNPYIVTIDKKDFKNNEDELKDKANKCLMYTSRIHFCLITGKHAS